MQVGSPGSKPPVDAGAMEAPGASQDAGQVGNAGDQLQQAQGRLAQIDAKYPALDTTLAHEQKVLEDIKDSDTWGGFKMYEKIISFMTFGLGAALIIGANKDMIRGQKSLVGELEAVAAERSQLQGLISQGGVDQFERS